MAQSNSQTVEKATTADPSARILTHMNKDHTLALYDYLHYYARIDLDPTDPKTSVRMLDMTPEYITLEYTAPFRHLPTKVELPVVPAVGSRSDGGPSEREALMSMAKEAAASQGYAPHRVTTYAPPSSLLEYTVICGTLVNIPPVRDFLLTSVLPPWVADTALMRTLQYSPWALALGVLIVHLTELVVFMRPLLNKWRVPPRPRAWWYLAALMEGFPAVRRFKGLTAKFEH